MKILLATYWPFPHVGGVSTYLEILRLRLEEMGHEVDILAQHPNLLYYYLAKSGQKIEKNLFLKQAESMVKSDFEKRRIPLSSWMLWRESEKYAFELACRQLSLDEYDLIHTQDIISTFIFRRTKADHIPLVATIHGCLATEWRANNEISVRTRFEQHYLSLEEYYGSMSPDCLILPSRWLSGSLSSFQIRHPRAYIIPYGLNQNIFRDILEQSRQRRFSVSSTEPQKTVIACPARLVAIKGQTYLLEAMKMLVEKRKDVSCWLIGDGVMRHDLEQRVKELGMEDYIYLWGNRNDVPNLLSEADIVVLPSLQDNLPFSIIEAHSLGKPVVASRTGGIVEMVADGITGFLTEPGNPTDLYEKLLRLVEDESLRREHSTEARKHALSVWNDSVMLERTLEVYEVANQSRRAALWQYDFISRLTQGYYEPGKPEEADLPPVTTLTGTITDANTGLPLNDAHIHLLDMAGVVLRNTTSDSAGTFKFQEVQPGNYELGYAAALSGMKTRKVSVSLSLIEPIKIEVMI